MGSQAEMTWPLTPAAGRRWGVTTLPKVGNPGTCSGSAPYRSDPVSAAGYLLETPSIRRYSSLYGDSDNSTVRAISRKGQALSDEPSMSVHRVTRRLESPEAIRQPTHVRRVS